ncbi:MAG: RdgB/HAM1 family non-canonical purine NTP pyrophosphatase [Rickettsiales bacterium]
MTMPLIVASHNEGKVREFRELLAPFRFEVNSAAQLNLAEPEETGSSFEANAELKARAAMQASGMLCLADDSGLVVPALDDAPGIYSARWAGPTKDFAQAMGRVARELHQAGLEPTGAAAYFVCVLALAYPNGNMRTIRGEILGTLRFPPTGARGFGYDPIFVASGYTESFGEMEPEAKNRISHRAKAFRALTDYLKQEMAA